MDARSFLAQTYDLMLREQLPNLFRLYFNPYVVQTCFCLERYVHDAFFSNGTNPESYQTFLANSFDEALSGAIKLARYAINQGAASRERPASTAGLVFDRDNRLGPFASAPAGSGCVEFVLGLTVVGGRVDDGAVNLDRFGFVVLMPGASRQDVQRANRMVREHGALLVVCLDRSGLAAIRAGESEFLPPLPPVLRGERVGVRGDSIPRERQSFSRVLPPHRPLSPGVPGERGESRHPDIVVFDDSFAGRDVPFGAFTARQSLYDLWNASSKSTFHSTTFQPNTISTLHFMRCLERDDPAFHSAVADDRRLIETDLRLRKALFARLYSPALTRAIAAAGLSAHRVRALGDFVEIGDRKVFDGVGGVACSVRGHNPPNYAAEMDALDGVDCEAEVGARLRGLTGLECMAPAVSGAGAVENALKIALVAQFPRRHVLALKSGFGGKTLFALTGTWNLSYKEHIAPLYAQVVYVDPFAADSSTQIEAALTAHDIAVVQVELIQGVGGVRRVPEAVVRQLAASRAKHDYLLLIDEVQTGMYRTGPFSLSGALGLAPDLLVIGKAISDMMFPFALTLYSAHVQAKLDRSNSDLPAAFRQRFGYAHGYKTALNVLRFAEQMQLAEQVPQAGALFKQLLEVELAGCTAVREVRVYGLLIGIELDADRSPQRWFAKRLFWFYLAAMLKQARDPVLVGFCQSERNVLKITPPLTVDAEDIRRVCATIGAVLRRPFRQLLTSAVSGLLRSFTPWRNSYDHTDQPAPAPVPR